MIVMKYIKEMIFIFIFLVFSVKIKIG